MTTRRATAALLSAAVLLVVAACGTDGGQGIKPSDRWVVSLCRAHHAEQHGIGERAFEGRYGLELVALAEEFARGSPHRRALLEDFRPVGRDTARR